MKLLLALLALAARGESRLWHVDVELRGPCDAVRIDCGSAGTTTLVGPFLAGETRRLTAPVPARAPSDLAALRSAAPPAATVLPAGALGSARVLGWSAAQPFERLAAGARAALARPRPPAEQAPARAGAPELALAAAATAVVLSLRRRPLAGVVAGLAAAVLVLGLARGRAPGAATVRLIEHDTADPAALAVRVTRAAAALPADGLEVLPAGGAIELVLDVAGGAARASAEGTLAVLAAADAPRVAPEENAWETLEEAWTRDGRGMWRARGAWPRGAPLPPPVDGAPDPPGWLAGALPPGRGILLGRAADGAWLRVVGFGGS